MKKGFTLIELMIVVAIIGILSAIAIPKFADMIRRSSEGATKGNLGAIRSAISIYYGENEGWFPCPTASGESGTGGTLGNVLTMQNGKYIKEMPTIYCPPYHIKYTDVSLYGEYPTEGPCHWGRFGYQEKISPPSGAKAWGELWINCTHTDSKGTAWSTY
ncbi:MAG: type II secretion system protein [Endomicrobiales bacterium]|nr:type II secretion system protein [Endomicrobiales bacterium]